MAFVTSQRGEIAALLFGERLTVPRRKGRQNKILWVARSPTSGSGPLQIIARRITAGHPEGPVVRRSVPGGPGPSTVDMPSAGCWRMTLDWQGHSDVLALPYLARGRAT